MQYPTCPFRHLQDLEKVPHPKIFVLYVSPQIPRGPGSGSPPSKNWSWINSSNTNRNGLERKPQTPRSDSCFTMNLHLFTREFEMIPRSVRTFWYKGSATNKGKWQVRKKGYILQKYQPRLEGWFLQKSMKSTFHRCNLNVSAVTNLRPMSKSDRYKQKTTKPRSSPKFIFIRILEFLVVALCGGYCTN